MRGKGKRPFLRERKAKEENACTEKGLLSLTRGEKKKEAIVSIVEGGSAVRRKKKKKAVLARGKKGEGGRFSRKDDGHSPSGRSSHFRI